MTKASKNESSENNCELSIKHILKSFRIKLEIHKNMKIALNIPIADIPKSGQLVIADFLLNSNRHFPNKEPLNSGNRNRYQPFRQ